MKKIATLLFVLFAIAFNCARLGRAILNYKEIDTTPLGTNSKINRPIEKEVKESIPEEEDTVEVPVQKKDSFVQLKSCCTKAQLSKKMMKCNCH